MTATIGSPSLERLLGTWNVDPGLIAVLAGCAVGYLLAARRVRGGWPRSRSALFLAGLAVLATALLSGIDTYADDLLSVHMVQHMLLMMVAPVLIVWSAPVRLALAASRASRTPRDRSASSPPCRGARDATGVRRDAAVHA